MGFSFLEWIAMTTLGLLLAASAVGFWLYLKLPWEFM